MREYLVEGTRGYTFKTRFLSLETLQLFAEYFDKYEFWMYDTPTNTTRQFIDTNIKLGNRVVAGADINHENKEIWVRYEYNKTEADFRKYLEEAFHIDRIPDLDILLEKGWYFSALKKYRRRKYKKLVKQMGV